MLGSITPLGERGRRQRWWLTVTALGAASIVSGALAGGLAGGLGALAGAAGIPERLRVAVLGALVGAGLLLDATRTLPTVRRQVNEDWLSRYRGWVYGVGFGAQLGIGVVTIVSLSAVYLALAAALLSASPGSGAVVGAAFGALRSVPLLTVASVRRPAQLVALERRLRTLDLPSRRGAMAAEATLVAVAALLASG